MIDKIAKKKDHRPNFSTPKNLARKILIAKAKRKVIPLVRKDQIVSFNNLFLNFVNSFSIILFSQSWMKIIVYNF